MEFPDTVWDARFVIPDNGPCVVSKLTARVPFLFAWDRAARRDVNHQGHEGTKTKPHDLGAFVALVVELSPNLNRRAHDRARL